MSVDKVRQKFRSLLQRKDRDHQIALDKAQKYIDLATEQQRLDDKNADAENDIYSKVLMRCQTPKYPFGERTTKDKNAHEPSANDLERADKKKRAIILIQRLLRGRAEQNRMFEGKEKRLDLIQELRATEEWRQSSETQEEHMLIDNYQERIMDGVAEALQSSIIAQTLDSLSKELVRLKQERKIDAMVRLAENDRRKREAEESGRR